MCLSNISERKIAGEDITCYKYLKVTSGPNPNLKHGDEFSCRIFGSLVNGKISIEKNEVYLCTNNTIADGIHCTEKFGYEYSWVWDCAISDFEGSIPILETPFQEVGVEIGETYSSNLYPCEYDFTLLNVGLHSISDLYDCIEYADKERNCIVVECIIPKGAEYYEGDWDIMVSTIKGYASSKLKYVRIIKN